MAIQLVDLDDIAEYVQLRSLTVAHNLLTAPLLLHQVCDPASHYRLRRPSPSLPPTAPIASVATAFLHTPSTLCVHSSDWSLGPAWQALPRTLTHLDLSHNALEALPTLSGLPHLEMLNVAHNKLQDVRAAAECRALQVVSQLRSSAAPLRVLRDWHACEGGVLEAGEGGVGCTTRRCSWGLHG
jgi:Leucine-rich repeat (LRR) protein